MKLDADLIEKQNVGDFSEKAYLEYSMYVILDRALPHISDGLKPVQRRIVYAMSQLGLKNDAKFKKSARTIGDVLGKFHPHGDTACYEAMVLMAQPFSYRYPLIMGQGNFGSSDDPKSFAAMRYTEAKLSQYAENLLNELQAGTVEWGLNFDGTLYEPLNLPARLPNVLLNGTTGIAVGMSTDLPPHNIQEVVSALLFLLDTPKASVSQLTQHILAPDFPTLAEIITPKKEIQAIYETGTGSIKMRATFMQQKSEIVISALPYGVSGAKILEQIAKQMKDKKLPMVIDLKDESDHETPTRLVIVLKSMRTNGIEVMDHLFTCTDLEKNYRINLNVIGLNGKPEVKNLKTLLSEWLEYRKKTVRKRLHYRLEQVKKRLHFLEGLFVVYLNLDAVIKIIRTEDNPKSALIKKFSLSENQAEGILEIKLRQLAKLEEIKIKQEQSDLKKEQKEITQILNSESRLKTLLKKEFQADLKLFSDKRRTQLIERGEAKPLIQKAKSNTEPMTVVLSEKGWIRAGKGHEVKGVDLSYKTGDAFLSQVHTTSDNSVILCDTSGRIFMLPVVDLPSIRGQGEPVRAKIQITSGSLLAGMMNFDPLKSCLFLSGDGYGFIAPVSELQTKNKNGKFVIKIPDNYSLFPPVVQDSDAYDHLLLATTENRVVLLSVKDIPRLAKGRGRKLIHLKEGKIQFAQFISSKTQITLCKGKREKILSFNELKIYFSALGKQGKKLPKGYSLC